MRTMMTIMSRTSCHYGANLRNLSAESHLVMLQGRACGRSARLQQRAMCDTIEVATTRPTNTSMTRKTKNNDENNNDDNDDDAVDVES